MKDHPSSAAERHHRLSAVFLRGMAMGAADIVPGVSGGTIAFITGIYLRLLSAIGEVLPALVALLKERKLARFWWRVDGNFLLALLGGILVSVVSLARIISHLLESQPVLVWSFFFGLIIAAVWHVGRQIRQWKRWAVWLALAAGTLGAAWITLLTPAQVEITPLTLLGGGALAICAMILPGISGSFILLLLGLYVPVLQALMHFDLVRLGLFGAGCLLGLLSIARLIEWGLRRFEDLALAVLTGFMLGSLNKVWPWKLTTVWGEDRHGKPLALVQDNVTPFDYASMTGEAAQWPAALLCCLAGFGLVLLLEWMAQSKSSPGIKNECDVT